MYVDCHIVNFAFNSPSIFKFNKNACQQDNFAIAQVVVEGGGVVGGGGQGDTKYILFFLNFTIVPDLCIL